MHRDPVEDAAGVVAIGEVVVVPPVGPGVGEAVVGSGKQFGDQLMAVDVEGTRVVVDDGAPPALEMTAADDVTGQTAVVVVDEDVLVDEVSPTEPVLDTSDSFDDRRVALEEGQSGLPLAAHQAVQDEQSSGLGRVDAIEADAATGDYREAVHRDPLHDHRTTRARVPLGVAVGSTGERSCEVFNPLGSDLGDPARAQAIGLHELRRHHPIGSTAREHRPGCHREAGPSRAEIVTTVTVAHAHLGEQTRQHRLMHAVGMTRISARSDADLPRHPTQLAVEVAPLADPHVVQVLVDAHAAEGIPRQFGLSLAEVVPERDDRQQVRTDDIEPAVQGVGALAMLAGSLTDILDGEGGGDHEYLAHAPVPIRLDDHAADPRVDRQPGEAAAETGQPVVTRSVIVAEGPEFEEKPTAVGDLSLIGWVDEREVLHPTEPEGRHLEDDRGEARPEDLRLGELRTGAEVVLGVEPDAHPRGDTTAPPGALRRRCLGHRLDRESLHLRATGIPADSGSPGVDHSPDPRHRDRGLGDVGGQHDATPRVRREHPLLLSSREPRVER